MKAARFYGAKDIRVEEIPDPTPGYGQVKLKVAWCGICGSDLHEYLAGPIICPRTIHPTTGEKIPITLGHEFSGTIVGMGEGVDSTKYAIGMNAIVEPVLHCRRPDCPACTKGTPNLCDQLAIIGLTGGGGGLSPWIAVDVRYVHLLPDNVPLADFIPVDIGACLEPLSVAWHAVKRANFRPGNTCLVVGSGPIGLFVLKVLKALGCGWVAVSEPARVRREKGLELGADAAFNPLSINVVDEVKRHTGGQGVDIAFECAGIQAGLTAAIAATKPRGVILNVSLWETMPSLNIMNILVGEKTLTASCCYVGVHQEVIDAVSSGKIKGLEDLITKRISLHDVVDQGFEALIRDKENQIKILVHL